MVYTVSGVNYTRRKKIPVTGAGSGAQIDYQIKLAAVWAASMQADFDDVRFTKADMQTLIDAWLESKVDSTSADIWVEFPTTPADGVVKTEAYMYFGNVVASSNWDIVATFLFGDDFEVAGIGDWTTLYGTPDYDSTTQARSATHSLQCSDASNEGGYISQTASDNIAFDSWIYIDSNSDIVFLFEHGDGTDVIMLADDSAGNIAYYSSGAWNDTGINVTIDAWKKLSVYDINWVAGTFKMSYDENVANCNMRQASAGSIDRITQRVRNAIAYYDDVRVRKYATAPPTAAFGTEEHQRRTPMMM